MKSCPNQSFLAVISIWSSKLKMILYLWFSKVFHFFKRKVLLLGFFFFHIRVSKIVLKVVNWSPRHFISAGLRHVCFLGYGCMWAFTHKNKNKTKKILLVHCREFYNSHAFLCDRENADKVTALITYGISHLDFDM